MKIPVSEAKAQLTELVRLAEAGEEIILTRHGHPAVRLAPIKPGLEAAALRAVVRGLQASVASKVSPGLAASHSQDFLYADDGRPA